MITNDEIAKLAREYAEEYTRKTYPNVPGHVRERIIEGRLEHMEDFIPWLLRTHCIVSKEKAAELCRLTLEHDDSVDYGLIDGLTDIVCDIFSEQYHQVAEGLDNPEIAKEAEGEVLSGWVARNEDGTPYLHRLLPERGFDDDRNVGIWGNCIGYQMIVPKRFFPSLTWDDDPMEVEITIKPKKKSI